MWEIFEIVAALNVCVAKVMKKYMVKAKICKNSSQEIMMQQFFQNWQLESWPLTFQGQIESDSVWVWFAGCDHTRRVRAETVPDGEQKHACA